eukprot:1153530-Pelagomonas_calceolata.AAC.1
MLKFLAAHKLTIKNKRARERECKGRQGNLMSKSDICRDAPKAFPAARAPNASPVPLFMLGLYLDNL